MQILRAARMIGVIGLLAVPSAVQAHDGPQRGAVRGDVYGNVGRRGYPAYPTALYTQSYDHGYQDGYDRGRRDARDRQFDPVRHSRYRSGDRGYKNKYGPRPVYQQVYRDAFLAGYEAAFVELYGPRSAGPAGRRGSPRGDRGGGFIEFGFGWGR